MNLLDKNKSLGALVLGLFLFISCEENGSFGLNGDDVAPVGFSSTDINVTSSVVLLDSIRSSGTGNWLVGTLNDPTFGSIVGTGYSRLDANSRAIFQIANEAVLDSVRLNLNFNYELDTTGMNTVWEVEMVTLGEPVADDIHISSENLQIATGDEARVLASGTIDVTDLDSLYLVDVDQDWGLEIFEMLRNDDPQIATQEAFELFFQGIALRAGPASDMNIRGVEIVEETNITFYYREPSSTGDIDRQVTHQMRFISVPNFYGLAVDRTGTPTEEINQFSVEIEPASGKRYVQSGTGIVTKINISAFRELLTDDPRIINLGEFSVGPIDELAPGLNPPPSLTLLLTDDRNTRIRDRGLFRAIQADGSSPITQGNPVVLEYDAETRTYRGSITSYLRSYFAGQFQRDEFFIYPSNMNTAVDGISFDPEDIRLSVIFSELQ